MYHGMVQKVGKHFPFYQIAQPNRRYPMWLEAKA